MKRKLLTPLIIVCSFSTYATAMEVELTDRDWDGTKIPKGQQCDKFGGDKPSSPKLHITNIPDGSDLILLAYSDRDAKNMNNGGHGIMSYSIDSTIHTADIPSVLGHSYVLPEKMTMVEAHRGAGWDKEGAYMPPCSGGKGHAYYLTVKAMSGDKVMAETVLELGKY
jgi:phosphatidylethanolamine-binding protein (PEBP) family uncharacterized protein